MRDIGIQDGDLLAVHASKEARSGQVIVARINQEVTVKRLKRKNKEIWLEAENPDFSNISINGERDEFAIEGIAVGIIRNGKIS
jgi:repressor LexA